MEYGVSTFLLRNAAMKTGIQSYVVENHGVSEGSMPSPAQANMNSNIQGWYIGNHLFRMLDSNKYTSISLANSHVK